MCFGGRTTREEREICLKIFGPFKFEPVRKFNGRSRSRSNSNGPVRVEDDHHASGRCPGPDHKRLRKAEEANFKANFSFFSSRSTAPKVHVFGVKFIWLYGTVGFIAIRYFYF